MDFNSESTKNFRAYLQNQVSGNGTVISLTGRKDMVTEFHVLNSNLKGCKIRKSYICGY